MGGQKEWNGEKKGPCHLVMAGLADILPALGGVGRGVAPRPQPQTGRASFQASGFPDDPALPLFPESTLDFFDVHPEASECNEHFSYPPRIILRPFAM